MNVTRHIERLANSRVKLSVTVGQADAAKAYSSLLADYSKKAQLPGFRRGHVPTNVLETKFGESLKVEAGQNLIEESLRSLFEEIEEKPLPYSMPQLASELDFSFDKDFTYAVEYDVFPQVEIGSYKGLEVEQPAVKITAEDEQRELDGLVEQNSFVVEKQGTAAKDDVVTINYVELDQNGKEMEATRREGFSFTVGAGMNYYGLDDDVIGLAKGEGKTVTKTMVDDHKVKEMAGKTVTVKLEMVTVKEKKKPEVNDEFAQDVSEKFKTLADLKADIRKRLEEAAASRIRSKTITTLMEKIIANSKVEVPESMVQAELESYWQDYVGRFRMKEEQVAKLLEMQGKTREAVIGEWREGAVVNLKTQLLARKMVEAEKVTANDEEIEEYFKERAEQNHTSVEEVKEYYRKNQLMELARRDVEEKKMFDLVLAENKIKKQKAMPFVELMA